MWLVMAETMHQENFVRNLRERERERERQRERERIIFNFQKYISDIGGVIHLTHVTITKIARVC